MPDQRQNTPASAEARFSDHLCSFVKMLFVYPENNVRVCDTLAACLHDLKDLWRPDRAVSIKFAGRRLISCGVVLEPPYSPMVNWLRETCRATALAGIEFLDDAGEAALRQLARRLRDNYTTKRSNPSFPELWGDGIAGLRLIEPRFRGRFLPGSAETSTDEFPDSAASETTRLGKSLHLHQGIANKLKDLQQILAEQVEDAALQEADIVSHIVHLLPEDVRNNPVALVKTVETILIHAADELRANDSGYSPEEQGFRKLLLRICRTFFVRAEVEEDRNDEVTRKAPRGHPGDEKYTDDLEAFLAELATLPPAIDRIELLDSPAEQLGVCVHQMFSTRERQHLGTLKLRLAELLNEPDEQELHVLREWIRASTGPRQSDDEASTRLLDFLRSGHYTDILRSALDLPTETIVAGFPAHFCLLIDCLENAADAAAERFVACVRSIGRARIMQKAGALIQDGILAGDRVCRLLAISDPALVPLAELILQHGDRSLQIPVVHFLRGLGLSHPAAGALCIDELRLTRPFLIDLCQLDNVESDSRLRKTAALLLEDFIAAPMKHRDENTLPRVQAVHALRKLWTKDVAEFVRTLARRRLWSRSSPPRAVREAARELLRLAGKH